MKNSEARATLFVFIVITALINFLSIHYLNKWYPVLAICTLIFVILIFLFLGKDTKPKRIPTEQMLNNLPYRTFRIKHDGRLPDKVDYKCEWTGVRFSGIPLVYHDYYHNTYYDFTPTILGQICSSCGKVSHQNSKDSGLRYSDIYGYDRAKCNFCSKSDYEPIVIIPSL
jgi:hypothetical protein